MEDFVLAGGYEVQVV